MSKEEQNHLTKEEEEIIRTVFQEDAISQEDCEVSEEDANGNTRETNELKRTKKRTY